VSGQENDEATEAATSVAEAAACLLQGWSQEILPKRMLGRGQANLFLTKGGDVPDARLEMTKRGRQLSEQ